MPYQVIPTQCKQSKGCIEECPMDAITFDEAISVAVIDPTLCTDCGSCADVCPRGAITGLAEE